MKRLLKGGSAILTVLVLCHCGEVTPPPVVVTPDSGTIDAETDTTDATTQTILSCSPTQTVPTFPNLPGLNGRPITDFIDPSLCSPDRLENVDPNGRWRLVSDNLSFDTNIDYDCQSGFLQTTVDNLILQSVPQEFSIHGPVFTSSDSILFIDYIRTDFGSAADVLEIYSANIICTGNDPNLEGTRISYSALDRGSFSASPRKTITFRKN